MKLNVEPDVLAAPSNLFEASADPLASVREASREANPDLSTSGVDQAYLEFCTRREAGESLDPDVFCARYPQFQSTLARLVQVHLYCEENLAEQAEPRWPEAGETFLDYQLVLELGRGAFARVFLATEPKLGNRLVAIKISPHGADEAEVLGRIRHPNIVPVYSVQHDAAGGLTGVVMPYAGSATLCDLLDHAQIANRPEAPARVVLEVAANVKYPLDPSGCRPVADAILERSSYIDGVRVLGAKLADALAYLHDLGICHRDLKPSNVLLSPEGEPMLLDFNLCADKEETLKRLGGTMPYMSPEQLRATEGSASDAAALDARSDIFALGVILYQLATGIHPFGPLSLKMTTPELRLHLVEAHRRGAVPPKQFNPNIDARLSALIERCLALDPRDRPASAAEIACTLRGDLTRVGRTRRWIVRNPGRVLAASLAIVTVVLSGVAFAASRAPYSERQTDSGTRLYQERRFNESADTFTRAIEADAANVAARYGRGRALQQMGKYQLALQDFQAADKLTTERDGGARDGRALACAAYCLQRLDFPKDAAAWYRLAIQAGFESAELYNNLGNCLTTVNHLEAKENLDRAIRMNSELQAAYHSRAFWVLRNLKSGPKGPNDPAFRLLRAGIADIEKAVTIGPASAELSLDAARLFAIAAKFDRGFAAPAVKHAVDFVDRGGNRASLADEKFAAVRSDVAFQKLLTRPALSVVVEPTRRLLDPVAEAR